MGLLGKAWFLTLVQNVFAFRVAGTRQIDCTDDVLSPFGASLLLLLAKELSFVAG